MKVALNAMQVRAAKSGVGQYIDGVLRAMVDADHFTEFTVYCTAQNESNYRLGARNQSTVVWGLPEKQRIRRLLHEYGRYHGELAERHYDVFHGLSNFLPVRKVCPYVVSIHDLSYHVHPQRCPFVRRQYWYAMTRRTFALADAIITFSEHTRGDIRRFFPGAESKVEVIPHGVDGRYRPVEYGREKSALGRRCIARPYVLSVGTLEPGKNHVRLIEAFDSIAGDFPQHLLLLAGDEGWLYEDIYRAARRARARDRILFLGHVADGEVVDLMNFCDVFAYPSLYEGFGLPPLEAMACGAPVVASNSSSIPEVVGNAAVLVDPLSVRDLAKALHGVLSDLCAREEMRAAGRERAAQFSWAASARSHLAVYRRMA